MARPPLSKKEFETLSEFRYRLRRFLRFSEQVTRQRGITPLQYLLLLHIKGFPGRDWATVGELAERLQAQHHGVVALISRCEKLGWVSSAAGQDRPPRGGSASHRQGRAHGGEDGATAPRRTADPAGSFLLPQLQELQQD
jgi:hypothetical protein